MTNPDALKRAAWLAAAYPGRSIDEAHIESWAEELAPLTASEVDEVISMLRLRAMDPPSVAQLNDAIREARGVTMSPGLPSGHVFVAETECPTCLVVHGEELDAGQTFHGAFHLASRDQAGEFDRAMEPAVCDCGFDVPSNVNPEAVVRMIAESLPLGRT